MAGVMDTTWDVPSAAGSLVTVEVAHATEPVWSWYAGTEVAKGCRVEERQRSAVVDFASAWLVSAGLILDCCDPTRTEEDTPALLDVRRYAL